MLNVRHWLFNSTNIYPNQVPKAFAPLPQLHFPPNSLERIGIAERTYLIASESRHLPDRVLRTMGSRDATAMRGPRTWIVTSIPGRNPSSEELREALETVHRGVRAVQVIVPRGADPNLCWVEYEDGNPGLTWHARSSFEEPIWARLYHLSQQDLDDLPIVVSGIALAERTGLRIMNSLAFLEHGLISRQTMIRALMFTVGLDWLLRAEKRKIFETRLCNLFGPATLAFPRLGHAGLQPRFSVEELASDLYLLRNELAHGKILHERFLVKINVKDANGDECFADQPYPYYQILSEAAAALLSRGLRMILLSEELRSRFESKKEWTEILSRPL